jgi:hypothetical protein
MDELDNMLGALTGAGIATLTQWSRLQDTQDSRYRNLRSDVRDVRDAFVDTQGYGEMIRLRLAVVQDLLSGISRASATAATPSPLPQPGTGTGRPDLCTGIEAAISGFAYPPRAGTYDARGNITALGELATVGTALTFEEVRAALHGFVICGGTTGAQRIAIYRGINALVETVAGLGMTKAEFAAAWARVFAPSSSVNLDPHTNPNLPPTIAALNGVTITVLPLNVQPRTDAAHRFTVIVGGGGLPADNPFAQVTFATPYRFDVGGVPTPFAPIVIASGSLRPVRATAASSTIYRLAAYDALGAGDVFEVSVSVSPGTATV